MTPTPTGATAPARCPKCGAKRSPVATAPSWQCPACGIAHAKCDAPIARARKVAAFPAPGDAVPAPAADASVWALLLVNVVTLAIAVMDRWDAVALMAAYWAQSVTIGVSNVFRILALERFSTEGLKINNRPVPADAAAKRQIAGFFAAHYGVFHAGYLIFLFLESKGIRIFDGWFWVCSAAFALNHFWSYRYNRDLDRQGTPNIGTLMFTPYLRVVPMHVAIVVGALFIHMAAGLILFGALKIVVDVAMHLVEHAQWRKARSVAPPSRQL